jgi:hypothetical protein
MPSGDVAAAVPEDIAQNTVPFQATSTHADELGSVLGVQVMPSGLVYAVAVPLRTPTNCVPSLANPLNPDTGSVLAVQTMPSGEVAAELELCATAQNTDPLRADLYQLVAAGRVAVTKSTMVG